MADLVNSAANTATDAGSKVDNAGKTATNAGNAAQGAGQSAKSAGDMAKGMSKGAMGGLGAVATGAAKQGMGAVTSVTDKGMGWVESAFDKSMGMMDGIMSAEKREELMKQTKKWSGDNPAMAIFSLPQVALSALPLFLFWFFTVLILILSLVLALLIALLLTVIFILASILIAVFVVLPVMFAAAFAGIFLALWGLMIYKFVMPKLKEKANEIVETGNELVESGKKVANAGPSKRRPKQSRQTVSTEDGKKMNMPNVPKQEPARKFQAKEGRTPRRRVPKKKKENPTNDAGSSKPAPNTKPKRKQPVPAN